MKIEMRRILKFKENRTDVIESDWEEWRILQQNKHSLIWTFNEQKLLIPNQSLIIKICFNLTFQVSINYLFLLKKISWIVLIRNGQNINWETRQAMVQRLCLYRGFISFPAICTRVIHLTHFFEPYCSDQSSWRDEVTKEKTFLLS